MKFQDQPVGSGNYQISGLRRVISKLSEMGITVPPEALSVPPHEGYGKPLVEFTNIEHAMLDWFDSRDYHQSQALIHYKEPRHKWHVIDILDEDNTPRELSPGMMCPSKLDAIGAVLYSCDLDTVRLDAFRKEGDRLIVSIGGKETVTITPVIMDHPDLAIRDRVRNAFKGVRRYRDNVSAHAASLPGYSLIKKLATSEIGKSHYPATGCMFLGFPKNWALAMKNALKQVGVQVKQSQAQELVAVFFGASNWHQLVKHQDKLNDATFPVPVEWVDENGKTSVRSKNVCDNRSKHTSLIANDLS